MGGGGNDKISEFYSMDIKFAHENFTYTDGCTGDQWIASGEIIAESGLDAINIFRKKLEKITSALSLIGQAYIEFLTSSSVTFKEGSSEAILFYYEEMPVNPLCLLEDQVKTLNDLIHNDIDYSLFLKYWKDITNTPDITPKIMLYCAALDSLTMCIYGNGWKSKKHEFRESILGSELKKVLFGTKEDSSTGLRHRLMHGEHYSVDDDIKLEDIHVKIINYFNSNIFKKESISSSVVSPQRNPYKNFGQLGKFIKTVSKKHLSLREIEKDYRESVKNKKQPKKFKFVSSKEHSELSKKF